MRLSRSLIWSVLLLICVPCAFAQSTSRSSPSTDSTRHAPSDSTAPSASKASPAEETFLGQTESYVNGHADDYAGFVDGRSSPFGGESVVYRAPPPLRYNRVEGIVLGLQREPLSLRDPTETARIYGQVALPFALRDLRYTVGVESKLVRNEETGLKVGISYEKQTRTPDHWKTSFAENSLGGIGFGYDFFDYYEAEGFSAYAVQALPPTYRITAGFRAETHRSLTQRTSWSLFDEGTFRPNPAAEPGRLHAAVVSLDGGHIEDRDDLPIGAAFRMEAVIGTAFGGDLRSNRYEVDGRAFLPLSDDTRLGLRLRGGYATSDAPPQLQFALGGIGSLRSYDQNALHGTRTLLGNVEYIIDGATLDDDFLDDLFLVGLLDAGWVRHSGAPFRTEDVLPSAGVGIGLDDREVRLDVSWPLRNVPVTGSRPSIWLRITPNF